MNRVKTTITITADPDNDRLMWYSVTAGTSNVIFRGKCYVLKSQAKVTLDITDVVNNYIYKGFGIFNPTWDSGSQGYQQPYTGQNRSTSFGFSLNGNAGEYNIANVTVKLYSESTFTNLVASSTINNVYFHSIAPEDEKGGFKISTYITNYYDINLVPHLPKISTQNLLYGQLAYGRGNWRWVNSSGMVLLSQNLGSYNSYVCVCNLQDISNYFNLPDNTLYSKDNSSYNKYPMLKLDDCARPYYLLWLNPNGGFQSYGFEKNTVPVENYSTSYRLTMDDYSYKANQTLNQRYRLKTGLVTDAEYKVLLTAARSPYCILYITEQDRAYYVNVTNTSMELKRYSNQGRKLFNFECEVELAEKEMVII